VTGDSLGQVASQTLPNLAVVEEAAELPLLRPLIDRDKAEIVEIAKQLGTYEISILPDEDCCQLFSSKLAVTRGHTEDLRQIERTADVEEIVDELVNSAELYHPRLEETRPEPEPALSRSLRAGPGPALAQGGLSSPGEPR
jgi:thiamine biosynthesis protein ThiI